MIIIKLTSFYFLQMRPMILRLLLEGSETDSEEHLMDTLMKYLDKNLIKLKHKLSRTNFDKMFVILWENASVALKELINTNIEVSLEKVMFYNFAKLQ